MKKLSLTILILAAAVTTLILPAPAHAIDWTHDCGGFSPTTATQWNAVHDAENEQECANSDYWNSGPARNGYCNHEVITKAGNTIWEAHMLCDFAAGGCDVNGFINCNGTKHGYTLHCDGVSRVEANGTSASCVTEASGVGVLCACSGSSIFCMNIG